MTETQSLSESMSLDEYLFESERFIKIKTMIYKANQTLSVLEAHKRTGNHLFCSTTELDRDIKKWAYIESRLINYAKNKAINLITKL